MKNTALFLMFLMTESAYADDWGCQVMLCMSNPAGPMAVAQCVPPMQRLYDAMSRKGFQWPTCDLAGKPDSPEAIYGRSGSKYHSLQRMLRVPLMSETTE